MTKYILNSGGLSSDPEKTKAFFKELVSGFGNSPKILLCHFAHPREYWEVNFESSKTKFKKFMPEGVNPIFTLAMPDTFVDQVKNMDAIYCHGGDDHLVMFWLKKLHASTVWEGKVVGTNSASTNAMAKQFWTCDWRQSFDGLGVLDIKTLPHFNSDFGKDDPRGPIDWEQAKLDLANYGDQSLPIYALEEAAYVVINK